ncbi:hypothetical protein EXU57_07820 [Segetibacter sp. 3557_3]|uniref:hypothetical protein n=1 Tax=Segetibacter sp. 3557_3 TaxID=2547429 RepID=UPI001058ADBD|nr:hypothetical protein [Segetibacter sp. 3557_3]TDH27480.1 hypothetical protein EXU57_07820 [Segetibacter sp. 3557_3]
MKPKSLLNYPLGFFLVPAIPPAVDQQRNLTIHDLQKSSVESALSQARPAATARNCSSTKRARVVAGDTMDKARLYASEKQLRSVRSNRPLYISACPEFLNAKPVTQAQPDQIIPQPPKTDWFFQHRL